MTNGDLLVLLDQAWHLINGAGGGDWEREGTAWHRDAAAWRDAYHQLRDRMKGDRQALERDVLHALQRHHWQGAAQACETLMERIDAYAETFPAHYVIRDPPADPG